MRFRRFVVPDAAVGVSARPAQAGMECGNSQDLGIGRSSVSWMRGRSFCNDCPADNRHI